MGDKSVKLNANGDAFPAVNMSMDDSIEQRLLRMRAEALAFHADVLSPMSAAREALGRVDYVALAPRIIDVQVLPLRDVLGCRFDLEQLMARQTGDAIVQQVASTVVQDVQGGVMSTSGQIHVAIWVELSMMLDEVVLVAVLADDTAPAPDVLSDRAWFYEEVGQVGLDSLLGLADWDDLAPGAWWVTGHLWGEHYHTVNGDDYDGGFEIEACRRLASSTDLFDLIQAWVKQPEDAEAVNRVLADLEMGLPSGRDRLAAMMNTLEVIAAVKEPV